MAGQSPSGNDANSNAEPPRKAKRTGYECEFVEPPPKVLQSECPICLQILREPHLIVCCGHSCCAACIERIEMDGKPCPLCQTPAFTHVANLGLKRALNEFRGYCPHRLRGCEWEGELGKLDEHLNSDSQSQHQLEGCPFAVIECLHCKEEIRRDEIAGHQLEHCSQRPYMCEYCTEYRSTFAEVVHSHWPECKCFLLPCPNECTLSGSRIQHKHLDQHVKEECPLTVVQCELHHAGCEVTLPRKDMPEHMKNDYIAHISLRTQELTRTKQELTPDKQELTLKVTSHSRELTPDKQELTLKVTSHSRELRRVERILSIDQQRSINRLQTQHQQDLQELRTDVELLNIVPVTIKMAGFDRLKMQSTKWHSHPSYTGMGGYKMCLGVDANGNGAGEGTHVSVYTYLMRGQFDSRLKWPFCGTVTIQLVNQLEDKEHRIRNIRCTVSTSATQVTVGE